MKDSKQYKVKDLTASISVKVRERKSGVKFNSSQKNYFSSNYLHSLK